MSVIYLHRYNVMIDIMSTIYRHDSRINTIY